MRRFFDPASIAVIGASERPAGLGGVVLQNLITGEFPGSLYAVNPHAGDSVLGIPCSADIASLPEVPELAIVCTSPRRIPGIVSELGEKGVKAVSIVMGGLSQSAPADGSRLGQVLEWSQGLLGLSLDSGKTLKEATWEAAQPYDMRILGPNSIGAIVPRNRLNASYSHCPVADGSVAFAGQSGVLALAMLDWAVGRELGFSHLTSVGDSLDVEISDVLEYLAEDFGTRAILLHLEEVSNGRRFVSALRAAARNKPVIVMKSRRTPTTEASPRAGILDRDLVYEAVFRRAGVLRVDRSDVLFNALETLNRTRRLLGERLAILCNGIGPALLAADHLLREGGQLAQLGEPSCRALAERLPGQASRANPVDISAAATPEHFVAAVEILLADESVDAVLILHVPTLIAPPLDTAQAVTSQLGDTLKPVLTCWMGLATARPARSAFDAAGISTFDSPEQSVDAFMHMVKYRRNQDLLDQSPRPLDAPQHPGIGKREIWALVGRALGEGRTVLTEQESMQAIAAAGIALDRRNRSDANVAYQSLQTVLGITRDEVFGPLLYLGTGDDPASAFSQRRVGLPPLNLNLAKLIVDSTAIGSELDNFSSDPEAIRDSIAEILVRLGQLVIEVPAIAELRLVPLLTRRSLAVVNRASITLGPRRETAITPYPAELEETLTLPRSGREVLLRPIRAEDAPAHAAFGLRLSPESIRYRFFGPRSGFTQHQLAQFTQIDYAREMAFIASSKKPDGDWETLGVVRTWTDPDNVSAEFAVIVGDEMRGEGLGYALMRKIIEYTRRRGTLEIFGSVLPDNKAMLRLADKLGFSNRYSTAEQVQIVSQRLNEPTDDWQRERLATAR
jgi:acyl-CoA synthetase (NDP forming)/RimJ/RimL family protein N-acetyltransferase